ncbi:MAG: LarC family nickel insertion protein [Sedimentibacter sp.]
MNSLFVECCSGVSGDMIVAALLDLGANSSTLLEGIESLKIDGYKIKISRVLKSGLNACDFDVILHEYTEENHNVSKDFERNIFDIYKIIDNSSISSNAKQMAKRIFEIKAKAEAKAHDIKIEEVYFHEIGAVDSIIDIVGAAICIDNLEIKEVIVSQINDGSGSIKCRRGIIPVPVPAVINIASEYNLNIIKTSINGEMVTPTGAAILAAIQTDNTLPENYKALKIGLGSGKRSYPNEGVLRMFLF